MACGFVNIKELEKLGEMVKGKKYQIETRGGREESKEVEKGGRRDLPFIHPENESHAHIAQGKACHSLPGEQKRGRSLRSELVKA